MRILGFKTNVPLPTEDSKVASFVAVDKPPAPSNHSILLDASRASVPDTVGLGLGGNDHVGRQLYPVCPLALADRHGKGADESFIFKTGWGLGYGMGGESEGNLRGNANYLLGRARDKKRERRSDEGAYTTGEIE